MGEGALTFHLDRNRKRMVVTGWGKPVQNSLIDQNYLSCYNVQINLNLMSLFTDLPQRTKLLIVASAMFLITLSMGLLVFGTNLISPENSLYDMAKGSVRADMLYIQPEEGGH